MDYNQLKVEIKELLDKYPFCECFSIGQSWEGRELYGIRIGKGHRNCLYVGAHHALEYCTTDILLKFAFEFCKSIENKTKLKGYNSKLIYEKVSLYIIPMLNPDGVELVLNGISKAHPLYERVTKMNNGSDNFSSWQSNIRGVDLNHNYNAGWLEGKMGERQLNIFFAGNTRYGGEYPESEKETAALCSFVKSVLPKMVVAFHAQGRLSLIHI